MSRRCGLTRSNTTVQRRQFYLLRPKATWKMRNRRSGMCVCRWQLVSSHWLRASIDTLSREFLCLFQPLISTLNLAASTKARKWALWFKHAKWSSARPCWMSMCLTFSTALPQLHLKSDQRARRAVRVLYYKNDQFSTTATHTQSFQFRAFLNHGLT